MQLTIKCRVWDRKKVSGKDISLCIERKLDDLWIDHLPGIVESELNMTHDYKYELIDKSIRLLEYKQ